jgi:tyrosine-protein kinase Etk/Wzc
MDERENQKNHRDYYEITLLDYLIILAKHSRMIICASAMAVVLTFLFLFILPNQYTATARLLPPQQNLTLSARLLQSLGGGVSPGSGEGIMGGIGGIGGMGASLLGLKSADDLYIAMMESNTVLDHLITRFHLMKLYKTKSLEEARKTLSRNAKITAGKKENIIVIAVTCTTPQMAAALANAFIEELSRLLQKLAVEEAKSRLAFLENEHHQASQNLIKAEDSLRLFSEKNNVLQIDTQTRGAIEYIARLRAEIDAKEVNIHVLRQQATPFNYDVVRLETEIGSLKEKLRTAETQRGNCENNVCIPSDKAPALALEYLRLFREVKYQESLYELFTKLVKVARLDMVRDVAVVQVLDPAMPPEKRSNKRLFVSVLVGISTFFVMVFVAFVREYIHNVNDREDDVQRLSLLKNYLQPWTDIFLRMKNHILSRRKL